MQITFFGLKSCDICRVAQKAISAAGIACKTRDVRVDGVPEDVLHRAILDHGADLVINKRSTTWRGLDENVRNSDAVTLLSANPTLMKRPLILTDTGVILIGWNGQVQSTLGID